MDLVEKILIVELLTIGFVDESGIGKVEVIATGVVNLIVGFEVKAFGEVEEV